MGVDDKTLSASSAEDPLLNKCKSATAANLTGYHSSQKIIQKILTTGFQNVGGSEKFFKALSQEVRNMEDAVSHKKSHLYFCSGFCVMQVTVAVNVMEVGFQGRTINLECQLLAN